MTTTHTPSDPLVLRLRGPRDTVEALPHLLGFAPESSVVVIGLATDRTTGRRRSGPVLRVDLGPDHPDPAEVLADVVPTLPDDYGTCVLVAVAPTDGRSRVGSGPRWAEAREIFGPALLRCVEAVRGSGRSVLDALLVADDRCGSLLCDDDECCPPSGTPWSPPGSSEASARIVAAGVPMPLPDRARLAERLAVDSEASSACQAVPRIEVTAERLVAALHAVASRVEACDAPPAPADLAVIHRALTVGSLRDRCVRWTLQVTLDEPARADSVREVWRSVARTSAPRSRSAACAVVALAALLSGDGAEANVAIDVGAWDAADPGAALVRNMVQLASLRLPPAQVRGLLAEVYEPTDDAGGAVA
jgi:hypothetical protein